MHSILETVLHLDAKWQWILNRWRHVVDDFFVLLVVYQNLMKGLCLVYLAFGLPFLLGYQLKKVTQSYL